MALFAQLDGLPSDLLVLDEMVHSARAIAEELGGEVRQTDKRLLDDRALQRLREQTLALLRDRAPTEGPDEGSGEDRPAATALHQDQSQPGSAADRGDASPETTPDAETAPDEQAERSPSSGR